MQKTKKQKDRVFMTEELITRIYCDVDDFCKVYEQCSKKYFLTDGSKGKVFPKSRMNLSEVMSIVILFHISGYRCFKWFYNNYVCKHLR